ncbi:MAG TPA: hypothetical protein PLN21_09190 [Gemmatales bacterium]|nr:hypothetical protein [Gemmatales bacterium]
MIKFWLALILGTIAISAGLTYLKLHRGAQTISYPAPAPKTKPPSIEFLSTKSDTDEVKMEISANVVTFKVKESKADRPNQVSFKISNTGEGQLELDLRASSSTSTDIYFDQHKVTLTDHTVKVPPGQSAVVSIIYTPKYEPDLVPGTKTKITTTFEHNDVRYSDNLHFEIETEVKR